ncbi:MAG: type I polyketide synthase [Endozoicomonas sp.]|uniref:type I polyketide synthase n=1 Tax=Endozoicomonas sp. TaxID=1892382 RepID=UPI003D9B558A
MSSSLTDSISIVGMACRFPGANDYFEFWDNLYAGKESIRFFSSEELLKSGLSKDRFRHPDFVPAKGWLGHEANFDPHAFGLSSLEAEAMEPQVRQFLQICQQCLEDGGIREFDSPQSIGVFAGLSNICQYFQAQVAGNTRLRQRLGDYRCWLLGSGNDYLATRIAWHLNLTGPAVTIQSSCSTGLSAVIMACQSLLEYQCDMALAGASSLSWPFEDGYFWQEGSILSKDGHCRVFDQNASGTVPANGIGAVLLRRTEDVIENHEAAHALITGFGINNDGRQKSGFSAPSIQGQTSAIRDAMTMAKVTAAEISMIEAHGTGTAIGDPIEVEALRQAFDLVSENARCALGSVKSNIGHLDVAAGIAGLIKASLCVQKGWIVPSLHFQQPNSELNLDKTPFYISSELEQWQSDHPRTAGVSSFGMGGTNTHIIIRELFSDKNRALESNSTIRLLPLSARTNSTLDQWQKRLVAHCNSSSFSNLSGLISYRDEQFQRGFILEGLDKSYITAEPDSPLIKENTGIVFLCTGQGCQFPGMGVQLYESQPCFREAVEECFKQMPKNIVNQLRPLLWNQAKDSAHLLKQTAMTQPALFIIEYAMAKQLMFWGIQPDALAGHSIGEYTAACLADILSLEDALHLVCTRGRLMQAMPHGCMLSAQSPAVTLGFLDDLELDQSVINTEQQCIFSGPEDIVKKAELRLAEKDIPFTRLHTSHAFHSRMMEPMLKEFKELTDSIHFKPPQIPVTANVTGGWLSNYHGKMSQYWNDQIRSTVRFSDNVKILLASGYQVFVECGPGKTLCHLVRQHQDHLATVQTLAGPKDTLSDEQIALTAIGQLWQAGIEPDWNTINPDIKSADHCFFPPRGFEQQSFWSVPDQQTGSAYSPPSLKETEEPRPSFDTHTLLGKVCQLWSEFLGTRKLGPDSDFYDLGGDSLLAIRLIAETNKLFGSQLKPHDLQTLRTPESMAKVLIDKSAVSSNCLIEMRKGDESGPQLYLIHPVGGTIHYYESLVSSLPEKLSITGIQSPALDGQTEPLKELSEIAGDYVSRIPQQESGEMILGGGSLGGMIAFEMACQLKAAGHEIAGLILLDAPAYGQLPDKLYDNIDVLVQMSVSLNAAHPEQAVSRRALKAVPESERLEWFLASSRHPAIKGISADELRNYVHIFSVYGNAMHNYRPAKTVPDCPALYVKAETTLKGMHCNADISWKALFGSRIILKTAPGNHHSMMDPPAVHNVAQTIGQWLHEKHILE